MTAKDLLSVKESKIILLFSLTRKGLEYKILNNSKPFYKPYVYI